MMSTRSPFADKAIEVLRENDRGSYTVPTKGLYPFQWNWDSCFTALGQSHYDMARAWTEIETLFARGERHRLILPDHVHPNAAGHAKIAEIFAAATRL